MSYITVKFLDKEFSIPEDVLEYIDLLDFTDRMKQRLINAFLLEIRKDDTGCIDDKDMAGAFQSEVGKFIAKLCDNGIYTRTVNDYLRDNKGYHLFSDVNKDALEKMKSLLIQEMDSWQAGFEDALYKKEASVTGMGFSIWSSSFVNHAIYAAMEASTLDKQEKEAASQYQKDMAALNSRLDSQFGAAKSDYISNVYIPHMETALTVFSYELLDKYIADLIANQKFDAKTLDYVDIGRSNDLLENLSLSRNKSAILERAFTACPYNAAVYIQAIKYELLDYETFRTAKVFKQSHSILSFLKKSWGEIDYPSKFQVNYYCINLLAQFTDYAPEEILHGLSEPYVKEILRAYSRNADMISDSTLCYKVLESISEDTILAGEAISKCKAADYVNSTVSMDVYTQLVEKCGHFDLLVRIKKCVPEGAKYNSKQEIDEWYEEKLSEAFEEARQELADKIAVSRAAEAKRKADLKKKEQERRKRNRIIKKLFLAAAILLIIIMIVSAVINKADNAKAYQVMAGEFCVFSVINDDGEEEDEFNWWLSLDEEGAMKMSSWSYSLDNCEVKGYSGALKNKADFRKFGDYNIEDYCADVSEYEKALYCYEFHIADEWNEFDGFIICWQYQNGKIVDVYCDDYRYSFVETSDDYSFNKWEDEINSDKLSKNVQKLIENIDVSEEEVIEEIENLIGNGSYDKAVEAIVASKLPDQQKNAYYDSLVKTIDFKTFDVNGLVINIPAHWYIEDYSDPYIRSAEYPEEDSLFSWYIKCMGTVEQVVRDGDDRWTRDDDYSPTTIAGCEEAYIRRELSKKVDADEGYSVIDYYAVCQGFVYKIHYFAYDERFFEPEMSMLLEHVEFTNYAENRADIQEQNYLNAIGLFDEGKYEEALSIFATLEGYKESEQKITECDNAIIEGKFNVAIALINEGKYKDALVLLDEIGDYKDAVVLKQKCALLTCETGDVITFGTYEQDGNSSNGTEAIGWIVLERDGNKVLVLSLYCLEQMPFNNTLAPVTWENCSLRKWLNGTFLGNAFSQEEQSQIVSTKVFDEGNQTTDKLFLLSEDEAVDYLTNSDRRADATEYVSTSHCYWFLRTTGSVSNVAYVSYDGEVGYYENVDREWWVRPAMWIEIGDMG